MLFLTPPPLFSSLGVQCHLEQSQWNFCIPSSRVPALDPSPGSLGRVISSLGHRHWEHSLWWQCHLAPYFPRTHTILGTKESTRAGGYSSLGWNSLSKISPCPGALGLLLSQRARALVPVFPARCLCTSRPLSHCSGRWFERDWAGGDIRAGRPARAARVWLSRLSPGRGGRQRVTKHFRGDRGNVHLRDQRKHTGFGSNKYF